MLKNEFQKFSDILVLTNQKENFQMNKSKTKDKRIIIRVSDEEFSFLHEQAERESRSITTIVNVALSEKYPEYKNNKKGK